ncbi:MAG: nicotinate phosphoribosyltransferase, partial [Clostridia bacterium]|nr:nicotinate phosphoribosyltransferase [Clostridia bacterium]
MNYTMLTDFYELTMASGYFREDMGEKIAYFDMYFRQVPDGGGLAVMAGVEQLIEYMKNLKFEEEDIDFLRSKGIFDEAFLDYLRNFKF